MASSNGRRWVGCLGESDSGTASLLIGGTVPLSEDSYPSPSVVKLIATATVASFVEDEKASIFLHYLQGSPDWLFISNSNAQNVWPIPVEFIDLRVLRESCLCWLECLQHVVKRRAGSWDAASGLNFLGSQTEEPIADIEMFFVGISGFVDS